MKTIPFTIEIKDKIYIGYLQITDISDVPKTYFVVLNNYIVGDLFFRYGDWLFDQGARYKILGKLTDDECNKISEYLGNIAVEAYQ